MTNEYDEDVLETFLKKQLQLFPEPVAENTEEAEYFLEDCLAVVCENKQEVVDYLEETMDITEMSEEEIFDSPEVFKLSHGRFLVVEG